MIFIGHGLTQIYTGFFRQILRDALWFYRFFGAITPVKLMIPFPEGTDIANVDIFYHNGAEWQPACDADGNVLRGGRGWMVPGSRVNHFRTSPPLVEIQVYHFSAAQGGFQSELLSAPEKEKREMKIKPT